MELEKIAELLLTPDALVTLSLQDARTVAAYMTVSKLKEGEVIFEANKPDVASDYMLLVIDGDVLIETLSTGEGGVVVNILSAGNLIGEMSVLDGTARSATCTAQTEVTVAMMTRSDLERLLGEHPAIAAQFLMAIAKRLADRIRLGNQKLLMLNQVNQAMQLEIAAKARTRKHRFTASTDV